MRVFGRLAATIWKLCSLGATSSDPDQLRLSKAILTLTALIIAFLAIFWGLLYVLIGYPLSGAIPLSYAGISFVSILIFFISKRFVFFRFSQLLLILLLPFLLMWSLGGFANGSVVMVWAFFTPLAAMIFGDRVQMTRWLFAFIALTLLSGLIDPYLQPLAKPMSEGFNTVFFVMNMGVGFVSIYLVLMSFVTDRETSHRLAIEAKNVAETAQVKLQEANRQLQANEARIRELMLTDPLTGVANRRHLEERLRELIANLNRYGNSLTMVMADIDHFKMINDNFGHDIGDHVIKSFAKAMQDTIRDVDFIARIGGEEFLLLLPETDISEAGALVDRIRTVFAKLDIPGANQAVTASFGIAQAKKGETGHECMKRADLALYDSKEHGRNRVSFSD